MVVKHEKNFSTPTHIRSFDGWLSPSSPTTITPFNFTLPVNGTLNNSSSSASDSTNLPQLHTKPLQHNLSYCFLTQAFLPWFEDGLAGAFQRFVEALDVLFVDFEVEAVLDAHFGGFIVIVVALATVPVCHFVCCVTGDSCHAVNCQRSANCLMMKVTTVVGLFVQRWR